MNLKTSRRKAISPVLATVILIAITLIAAIAIAGFVFGLFGTFTSTARVSVVSTSCVENGGGTAVVCTILLSNTGNAPTSTTSCSFTGSNDAGAGTLGGSGVVASGGTLQITCTTPSNGAGVGAQLSGTVGLTNGGQALFTANRLS